MRHWLLRPSCLLSWSPRRFGDTARLSVHRQPQAHRHTTVSLDILTPASSVFKACVCPAASDILQLSFKRITTADGLKGMATCVNLWQAGVCDLGGRRCKAVQCLGPGGHRGCVHRTSSVGSDSVGDISERYNCRGASFRQLCVEPVCSSII